MKNRSQSKAKSWEALRNQSDALIKTLLERDFPSKYGYPRPEMTHKSYQEEESTMGRALLVYTRCDLTLKTMELCPRKLK